MKEVTAVVLDGAFKIIIGVLLVASAQADTPKSLRACTVAWPPFVTINKGTIAGRDTETLQKAVQKMGYTDLKIEDVPWKRCLKMAEDGDVDIVYPASKNPEREAFLYYPKTPLHPVSYVFVTKSGAHQEWTTKKVVSSLPQPIGIPLGYSISEQLHKEQGVQLDENAKDDRTNMEKLAMGRVGAIIIEKMNAIDLIEELKEKDLVMLEVPYFEDKEYYVTVSKKSPQAKDLTAGLDKVLPTLASVKH